MNCMETKKYLSAFVDNELDTRTNIDVVEHLRMCESCGSRLEEMAELQGALVSHMKSIKAPESLKARIAQSLLDPEAHRRRFRAVLRDFAANGWVRALTAAASILLVFTLTYAVLLRPPAALNSGALAQHIAVLSDQVPAFQHTASAERARRLALRTMKQKPDTRFLESGDFQLVGAAPVEIDYKNVGHFVFRYRGEVVSMFVFEGLGPKDIGGREISTKLGTVKIDTRKGLSLLGWQNGNFTYVLVSRLSTKRLLDEVAPKVLSR